MGCKHVKKLKPLSEGDKPSYLLTLTFKKPTSFLGYPLYMFRVLFSQKLTVYFDEVEAVTWKQDNSEWSVSIPKRADILGLDNIDAFIDMKSDFYQFVR